MIPILISAHFCPYLITSFCITMSLYLQVPVNERALGQLSILNHGQYSFEYQWRMSERCQHPGGQGCQLVAILPEEGVVEPNDRVRCELAFAPPSKMVLKSCELILEVCRGIADWCVCVCVVCILLQVVNKNGQFALSCNLHLHTFTSYLPDRQRSLPPDHPEGQRCGAAGQLLLLGARLWSLFPPPLRHATQDNHPHYH